LPEGDALHRAARRLQPLVGERVEVETPHPRGAAQRLAERLNGRRLLSVRAVGKNLLLEFEGGLVLHSHLRMNGRWTLVARGSGREWTGRALVPSRGQPWLVLRGSRVEARQWNGPVLELHARSIRRLGPDILDAPPDLDTMLVNLRRTDQGREVGDALLDQRLVAGIGNKWKAEVLWQARLSPWRRLGRTTDDELRAALETAATLMRRSLDGLPHRNDVYRLVGRPCPRCGERVRSRGQGDANRIAYWCPGCQL
jgi:endonuclease VIII